MKTILIVDDNPANLGILFHCLDQSGYRTLVAQDGETALKMAKISRPNMILLDVIMPEMDGFMACHALKSDSETRDIPVIFMTALTETADKVAGFQAGAVDYICKPIQKEEILARIHLHMMLQEQKNQLLRINREKEKILSVVAHDLKAPFSSVLGFLGLLAESYEDYTEKEKKRFIAHAHGSTLKLYEMLEKLLDWTRTGSGFNEWQPEILDLTQLIHSTVSLFKENAEKKKIRIRGKIPGTLYLFADANMIASVLRNLISNAIKFTDTGGRITITADQSPAGTEIRISDTGIGMNEQTVSSLLSGSCGKSTPGTTGECGTGLGMVICREFIEKNKGTLAIESTPSKGSCFILTFPPSPSRISAR
ncbi:hybrid sensor histidine kinase/response regulator [Desulfobotulus sp. H1]|uniref:histidine kinase n=1 Tax=Desulfobotulus pelophilus TaxID=2823377 RepID=A0ABT3NDK9_9BACT|nr:hybrid sensor histidine kinase/response regulator [Desulfobotulus pelophilus]MCW7755266.1 hybrid sensor histidine kinase/response regulator [Desulfobotulus pelophilus]